MRPLRKVLHAGSLALIGVPKSFINTTINDFIANDSDLEEVKECIVKYINNIDENISNNLGIMFMGSNGVGKTMLSSIILKEAYRHRYTSRRTTFVKYIDTYTRAWGAKSTEEKESYEDELYNYYKAVEFLVVDEVGKEVDSKVSAPILEDLLRYREDNGLTTIICTNLDTESLLSRYGESCMSIFKGNFLPITINSDDIRSVKERL